MGRRVDDIWYRRRERILTVKVVQLTSVTTVPNAITVVINDAAILKEKKVEIDVKIFVAQRMLRPFPALRCDHLSLEVMPSNVRLALRERVFGRCLRLQTEEVGHQPVQVIITIIHGNEVTPGEEPGVMPFPENSCLDPQGFALLKGAPPTREAVSINVDKIFRLELLTEIFGLFVGPNIVVERAIWDAAPSLSEADIEVVQ